MFQRKLSLITIGGVLLLTVLNASAKDIYVASSGSDGNNGATASAPLKTLSAAAKLAYAGDTVWVLPGRYSESIVPARSGTSGRPITFRRSGSGRAVIEQPSAGTEESAIFIAGQSDIVVDGIDVDGGSAAPHARLNHFATIRDSSRITIQNATFKFANGWGGIWVQRSSYLVIQDNDIDMVGQFEDAVNASGEGTGDAIFLRDANAPISHCLVQRNRVRHGGHDLLRLDGDHNVAQDNYFNNDWNDIVGGGRGYRSVSLGGSDNVFQRNYVSHAGNGPSGKPSPMLMKVEGVRNIARNNVLAYGVAQGIQSSAGSWTVNGQDSRIYNNTIYSVGGPAWEVRINKGYVLSGYVFKNNLVVDSRLSPASSSEDSDTVFWVTEAGMGATANSSVVGNIFAHGAAKVPMTYSDAGGGRLAVSDAEKKYPTLFHVNGDSKPQFLTASLASLSDFSLSQQSAGVDQGVWLTTVATDGTSNRVPIADTLYFTDGNGITPGDVVQFQSTNQRTTIASIDRAAGILVLTDQVRFSQGQGLALEFLGSSPDVGAGESGADGSRRPMPPAAVRVD